MPIAFIVALMGSLAIHGAALFGTDVELFGGGPEPPPLRAEIQSPPAAPPSPPTPAAGASAPPRAKAAKRTGPERPKAEPPEPIASAAPVPPDSDFGPDLPSTADSLPPTAPLPPPPARPILPASGVIRFVITKESIGLPVGRAEHRWEFKEDGSYRLHGTTETTGLAALLKPMRLEVESAGRMTAGGLQPERFRSLKNGQDSKENADFDWTSGEVRLARDDSVRAIAPGTQDILSLNYQLAFLGRLAEGQTIGVVTGKKYERYELDALGEEEIEVPAGRFRTLHLRAMTDTVTEIWVALDHARLPVKIRFTDKKGESFEQLATELGK